MNLIEHSKETVFSVDEDNVGLRTAILEAKEYVKDEINDTEVLLLYKDIFIAVNKITDIDACIERFNKVRVGGNAL